MIQAIKTDKEEIQVLFMGCDTDLIDEVEKLKHAISLFENQHKEVFKHE